MSYKICARCVMDTSDPDIDFDESGLCNHCRRAAALAPNYVFTEAESSLRLGKLAEEIRASRRGRAYDCILGMSGGIDSSYVAYLAGQMGLTPLAVHFDNGWNSEIAVSNIKSIVQTLGLDLHTEVINWEEFRDLQRAFLKASVIDIEMLSDHAMFASMTAWRASTESGTCSVEQIFAPSTPCRTAGTGVSKTS